MERRQSKCVEVGSWGHVLRDPCVSFKRWISESEPEGSPGVGADTHCSAF